MHLVFILESQFPRKVKWLDTKNIKGKSLMIIGYSNVYTLQYDRLLRVELYTILGLFKFWDNHVWFTFSPALDYVLTNYCDRNKLGVELSTKISVLKSQNPQNVLGLSSKWNGKMSVCIIIMLSLCGPNASAKSTGLIVYYC